MNIDEEELAQKLKNKKDLHEYMTTRRKQLYHFNSFNISFNIVNYHLPEVKYCRLGFLQAIICDEKKVLEKSQIKDRIIKHSYSEFAVKNVWDLVCDDPDIEPYMPDQK